MSTTNNVTPCWHVETFRKIETRSSFYEAKKLAKKLSKESGYDVVFYKLDRLNNVVSKWKYYFISDAFCKIR